MNILLVSALEMETDNKLDSYLPHNLIHTGVGKINATYHLTRRLLVDRTINYEANKYCYKLWNWFEEICKR